MTTVKPRRRTEGLVIERLDGEALVYDLDRHRAHSLEPRAAAIWDACDGARSLAAIGRVGADAGAPALEAEVVRVVVERLDRAHLLAEPIVREDAPAESRRQLLRRAAALGGLAVLTVSVPSAAFAASCIPSGDPTCVNASGHDLTGRVCCSGQVKDSGNRCGKANDPSQDFPYVCR